jgi:hypothetical protein
VPLGLHVGERLGIGERTLAVGTLVAGGGADEVSSPPHPAAIINVTAAAANTRSVDRSIASSFLDASERDAHVWFVTNNPAIVARRDVVRVPGPDVLLRAIVGPYVEVAGDRVAHMVSLAAICPHELLDRF